MCNCKSNKCSCNSTSIPQGPPGTNGTNGINGTNGNSILNGSGVPSSGTGVNGDFYIDLSTNEIYGPKTDSGWGSGTSLIGPPGDPGICPECLECNLEVSIERDDNLTLVANVSNGTAPYIYQWEKVDGGFTMFSIDGSSTNSSLDLITGPFYIYPLGPEDNRPLYQGLFKVTVTDDNGCKKDAYFFHQYFVQD
jgi:hypothetical protein